MNFFAKFSILGLILLLTACEEDPCKSTSCLNDGVCNDGTCDCPPGWTGTDCGTPTIPTDGLLAYFPFNGNANDESGSGNNGTVYGATLSPDYKGQSNNAYYFDGVDDYVQFNQTLGNFRTTDFSLSLWTNISNASTVGTIAGKRDVSSNGNFFQLNFDTDWLTFEINQTTSADYVNINTTKTVGWSHIVVVRKGTSLKVYVNGKLTEIKETTFVQDINNFAYFTIGKVYFPDRLFKGSIDNLRIYGRALTDAEVTALSKE